MYKFVKEQEIFEIGKTRVGGQPGELPTVLVGTIFYGGHKIVKDAKTGQFDKAAAESLIKKQEEMSQITGNPHFVQVFAEGTEPMRRQIDFVAKTTDAPFLIDSTDAEIRMFGAKYVNEVGLAKRAIYNSLNVSATEKEIANLREYKLPASIVLAFNPKDTMVKGRMEVLTTGAGFIPRGLLDIAKECDLKPLIDVAATALGSGAGGSLMASYVVKSKLGLPVGSGIHNAVSAWTWLKKYKKENPEGATAFKTCDISSAAIQIMCGGNFILYGPIENAALVFPVCAFADSLVAEAVSSELAISPSENHPLKKLVLK